MSIQVNAEVISIGTEILLGELTDTNSVFIARVLRDLGINLYFMTSVGDNQQRIADAISIALNRADVIITCGGLGPTVDDMTRPAIASVVGRELVFHQELMNQIVERFASFKVKMTENNRRQAYLPDGAIPIVNPVGTAPSFIVESEGKTIISLPGVPREMKFLMTQSVLPYLHERYHLGIIKARTLKTAGIGESALDELIGPELLENSNPTIGLAAHSGQIDVRITAKADSSEAADTMIADTERKVRDRVGAFVFGADDDTLEAALVKLLEKKQGKLAFVQAGIDDVLAPALVTGESDSVIIATNEIYGHPDQVRLMYAPDQALTLRDLARQVAKTVCNQHGAAGAIVILSDPEINEGDDLREGTVVAVYVADKIRDRGYGFGAQSEVARNWVTMWSLSAVWSMLRDYYGTK